MSHTSSYDPVTSHLIDLPQEKQMSHTTSVIDLDIMILHSKTKTNESYDPVTSHSIDPHSKTNESYDICYQFSYQAETVVYCLELW